MKHIYIILIMMGVSLASCDMDKKPYGSLEDQTAIQSLNDAQRFRNGLYTRMRGLTTGAYVYTSDIQMDIFHGIITNGNRNGMFSNGNILSSDTDIESMWANNYAAINSANYLIETIEALLTSGVEYTDAEQATLKRYAGEAYFVRGYCYYWLFDHFCEAYTAANAQVSAKGLPLVTVYDPTGDMSKYPGRDTQEATLLRIEEDLNNAYTALTAYETADPENGKEILAPNAIYFSSHAVQALQARVALLKGDNQTALSKAEAVINSAIYTLADTTDYVNMWTRDESTEIIFRSFMANTELGSSTGVAYLNYNMDGADFIPTYDILNMYGEGDVRFDAFFKVWPLNIDGNNIQAYVFHKYPGNESLKVSIAPNYMNMSKLFRLSEMYLIAAESAITTDATKANKYLNDLRAKRIVEYTAGNYTGQQLVNEIRLERFRELLGEGYRMSDLRRWGLGFSRNPEHPENPDIDAIVINTGKDLAYLSGDHRFVWPIPTPEMEANPQLDGQQNPGY